MDSSTTLSPTERQERAAMVQDAHFLNLEKEANARLLQCQSDMKAYAQAIKLALKAGESEESLYIQSLTSKLLLAVETEQQLIAVVGPNKQVA